MESQVACRAGLCYAVVGQHQPADHRLLLILQIAFFACTILSSPTLLPGDAHVG